MRVWVGRYLVLAGAIVLAPGVWAQSGNRHAPTSPRGGIAGPSAAYGSLLDKYETEMGIAKAMPAEKYDFSPASLNIPNASYAGVRTFADEVRHVAQMNYRIFGEAGQLPPDRDVKAMGKLKSKDELVAALEASFVFAHKAVETLTAGNVSELIPGPELLTRGTMAAHGVAHGYDHYGQMVEYLRMNGVLPPGSK